VTFALLNQANIQCGDEDVILSRGPGYRFSEKLSVQDGDDTEATVITDMDDTSDVPNVRNDDVRNVPNVPDDAVGMRRTWILQRLDQGHELQAPTVAKQFTCSVKTAQRDLRALKEEGVIEFVGASRTGYYRLRKPPESDE
jgi:predicted HTH transcriptional regulator